MQGQAFELHPLAVTLWWITLIVTVLLVPVAWWLLHRTWRAARQIRRYTERSLEAGVGIAGNTAAVRELQTTLEMVAGLSATAAEIKEGTAALRDVLSNRASRGGAR